MFTTPEFKVGALVVIVSGLIGVMSLKVNEGPGIFTRQNKYWFEVPDASGLVEKSGVRSAGIRVGSIDYVRLVNGNAKVQISIDRDVVMRTSGYVELRSDGILGDRYVEVSMGEPSDPLLEPGSQILTATDRGSINAMMKEVGRITDSLATLADTLNKATGPDGDEHTRLGRIFLNIENLSKDLADISGGNKGKINEIVDRIHSVSQSLDSFLGDDGHDGFAAGWEKAVASLHRIDSTLRNIEEITYKINRGDGTIGRLVNDEETVDRINEAVASLNEFLGGAGSFETSLDFRSEYLASPDLTKTHLNLRLQPGLDRYYEVGIVDDPRGVSQTVRTETTGSTTSDITETKTFKSKLKFNAIFAKNFYNFTVRGGLMESRGGVGFDYHFRPEKLRFSVEAYDFEDVVLRAYMRYNIMKGIYLTGGGDFLTDDDLRTGFLGAGIFITNDDLKMLATKISF